MLNYIYIAQQNLEYDIDTQANGYFFASWQSGNEVYWGDALREITPIGLTEPIK